MHLRTIGAVAVLAAWLGVGPAHAEQRSETHDYGGPPKGIVDCRPGHEPLPTSSTGCFATEPGDSTASVVISDDSGSPIPASYTFGYYERRWWAPTGGPVFDWFVPVASGAFCESVTGLDVPTNATYLRVSFRSVNEQVIDAMAHQHACDGSITRPTTGTISATLE